MKPTVTWHPQLDNPDFLGWSVVAAYLLAAISCGSVALKAGKWDAQDSKVWWLMAAALLFLGVNKQLNLQTLMIELGRYAASAGGWYKRRRFVQRFFCGGFVVFGLCFLGFFAARARHFIGKNRLASAGVIVLVLFVVLRASTINHGNELFGVDLKDKEWAWVLELCGSFLIIRSAASAAKSIPSA